MAITGTVNFDMSVADTAWTVNILLKSLSVSKTAQSMTMYIFKFAHDFHMTIEATFIK